MARVAVLGATGGVGRYVCRAFAGAGYDVLAVARTHAPQVADHRFLALDPAALAPDELAAVIAAADLDVVVNATGGWGITDSEMAYTHVRLVGRLVDAVAAVPRRPRLIQVGSIHEYGPVPTGTSIREDVTPRPATAYAATKLAGADHVLRASRAGAIDGVVLRAVNVCGPHSTSASFLGSVAERLRHLPPGQRFPVTIADARRDFIDVRDLADAVVRVAQVRSCPPLVNIGRGAAVRMRALVTMLAAAAGLPAGALDAEVRAIESKGGGWTRADISLARTALQWRPQIGLAASMRAMLAAS
ncbi:MAG TPA: NAD(P)-dependent oxidoreductase [Catenuloplanes sp.]|jgi:nucleoside-diphosphate-sugar epimerase